MLCWYICRTITVIEVHIYIYIYALQRYHKRIASSNKLAWDLTHWLRYLTRLVAEKIDTYPLSYTAHMLIWSELTYILCATLLERHPTLSNEKREHYTQYIITQTFTAWWTHSSGVTRVGTLSFLTKYFFPVSLQCRSRFVRKLCQLTFF